MKIQARQYQRKGTGTLTAKQSSLYRLHLWPAAAAALGCSPRDEVRRRQVTETLTKKTSTGDLTNREITVLFRGLELIAAGGLDLEKAAQLAAAEAAARDGDLGDLADLIGLITAEGFNDAYLDKVAAPHMRREGKDGWRKCSFDSLRKVLFAVRARRRQQRRNDPSEDRPPMQRAVPYHERSLTKEHEAFMRALRAAVPSGRLEEITPTAEAALLDGIASRGVKVCTCLTCRRRRAGELGNAAWEKRAADPEDADCPF